jgi:hypothetical protein
VFRRRRRSDEDLPGTQGDAGARDDAADVADTDATDTDADDPDADDPDAAQERPAEPTRPQGPWDVADVPDETERFDLGGLRLAVPEGAQVQIEVAEDLLLPTIFYGEAALQLSAFAAPRRAGIWDEVRAEIAEAVRADGGTAEEVPGPFGTELRAQVPVQAPDGSAALQPARFVGVDGPRWFLRGLFTGAAVADREQAAPLEEALRQTVVVRGNDAMAPREPIVLRVPREVLDAAGVPADQQHAFDPFERGPEITEVR